MQKDKERCFPMLKYLVIFLLMMQIHIFAQDKLVIISPHRKSIQKEFVPEFKKLQDELDSIHKEYIGHTEKIKKDVQTIEKSVQFMKSIENKYNEDESVKEIVDKLNKYSESIFKNEKLSEIREKYINKRKELNSFIYFFQKINKWNVCNMCPMCFSNKVDSYCNPCGHTGCKECFNRQTELTSNETFDVNNSKKCPFCRDYIIDIKPLYFL